MSGTPSLGPNNFSGLDGHFDGERFVGWMGLRDMRDGLLVRVERTGLRRDEPSGSARLARQPTGTLQIVNASVISQLD